MNTAFRTHKRRMWRSFAALMAMLLAVGLLLMPQVRTIVYPTRYIKSDTAELVVQDPSLSEGEVEFSDITLLRGDAVTVLSHGKTASIVSKDDVRFSIDNKYLADTLEEALDVDTVWARRRIYLRADMDGPLLEESIAPGEAVSVSAASPDWLDRDTGEMRWYQIEKDGSSYYIPGTAVSCTEENLSTDSLDLEGYTQPDYDDNPRLETRSGIHITLENLIKYQNEIVTYLKESGMNTLVVALKGPSGQVWYDSDVPAQYFHDASDAMASSLLSKEELESLVRDLHNEGIYMVARFETFQDSHLAADSPEKAITLASNGTPANLSGSYWLSPYLISNWMYNVDLAKEAAQLGFNEVQFDFCRFPDGRDAYGADGLDLKNADGDSEAQAVQNFLYYAREELEPYHVYVAADVFAGPVYEDSDYGIGQSYPAMLAAAHYVCPMPYLETLQFLPENLGIEVFSNAQEVMAGFTHYALTRAQGQDNAADVVLWLQGFGLMSPETLHNQIEGLRQEGTNSWMLWSDEGDLDILLPLEKAFEDNSSTHLFKRTDKTAS